MSRALEMPLMVQGSTPEAVLYGLDWHLSAYDQRFKGQRGKKNRKRARAAALRVLTWWREKGLDEYAAGESLDVEEAIDAAYGSGIAGFLLSLIAPWIAKMVATLLLDWIINGASELFLQAEMQARQAGSFAALPPQ